MKLKLHDVWHYFGSYTIENESNELLGKVKMSNLFGRPITSLYRPDGSLICKIQAAKLIQLVFFTMQVRDASDQEIGLLVQRARLDKMKPDADHAGRAGSRLAAIFKWFVGIYGDFHFKGATYEVISSWPFFEAVEVKKDTQTIMRLQRKVKHQILDFFLLRHHIPKLPYEVLVCDESISLEDTVTIALSVRQWVRHHRYFKGE